MNTIDVWLMDLEAAPVEELALYLDGAERQRASKFHFERDRRRWIASRGGLRVLLANYSEVAPSKVSIVSDSAGKPRLEQRPVEFSVSHSGDLAAYAMGRLPLGIDIELIDDSVEYESLVRRFCSPHEAAELNRIPDSRRRRSFFDWWVRKEAVVKAVGKGLSVPLESFDVAIGLPASIVASRTPQIDPERWRIEPLDAGPRHAGAVATSDAESEIVVRPLVIDSPDGASASTRS